MEADHRREKSGDRDGAGDCEGRNGDLHAKKAHAKEDGQREQSPGAADARCVSDRQILYVQPHQFDPAAALIHRTAGRSPRRSHPLLYNHPDCQEHQHHHPSEEHQPGRNGATQPLESQLRWICPLREKSVVDGVERLVARSCKVVCAVPYNALHSDHEIRHGNLATDHLHDCIRF
eukprot:scaffold13454_cov114-Isochrysis_galbana.AAC.2